MRPESLAVIGLGAIGGSIAWQARLAGVPRVVGYSPEPSDGAAAVKAAAVTEFADSAASAARACALVVLATPPHITLELIAHLAGVLPPGALLTDVASVKGCVMRRAAAAGLADRFAGAHPLAGTHGSGFAYARPDRLRGCVVYVCASGTPAGDAAARGVMSFWERTLEAAPVLIDAEVHDRQLAWTSHLPQAAASALAKTMADRRLGGVSYGAGARDTTRLAASSPELWVEILLENREAVGEALERLDETVRELRELLARGDAPGLKRYLAAAAAFRQGLER